MSREELYYGLNKISKRLGVSVKTARELIHDKKIRAFRLKECENAPWCCIESELSQDIKQLGVKPVNRKSTP